jgi:rRNA maturation protein Rpf1
MFLLKSIRLTNKILVSTEKIIGAEVLFIILGKSFIYERKSRGPKTEPYGAPCLILAQFETLLSFRRNNQQDATL